MRRWAGWVCLLALAVPVVPILRYASFDRAVLGRYSVPYFVLICAYLSILVAVGLLCFSSDRLYHSVFNRRLAYVLAMIVLALATGEIAARSVLRNQYMRFPRNFLTHSRTAEYDIEIRTNSRGFRDREHRLRKPKEVRRIAVIGDSFVWGSGVQASETFPRRLEQALNGDSAGGRSASPSIEVLSFGVSGTGPVHYLKLYRGAVRPYRPDLVIVSVYVGNDLRDALKESQARSPRFALRALIASVARPWQPAANAGGWSPFGAESPMEMANLLHDARERGIPADSIRKRLARLPEPLVADAIAMRSNPCNMAEALLDPDGIRNNLLADDDEIRRAWPIVDRAITDLDREVRRTGGRMILLLIPASAQINRIYWRYSSEIGFLLDDRLLSESPVQDHLSELAASRGIECVELLPAFRSRHDQILYFIQDGHWTPEGHRLAAKVLSERLRGAPELSPRIGRGQSGRAGKDGGLAAAGHAGRSRT
jgi:hypothetical protein